MSSRGKRRSRSDHNTDWIVEIPLSRACILIALLALVVLILAWTLWGFLMEFSQQEFASARATAALTTVGGMGGSVYLIVRYRAQYFAEKQHKISRLDHNEELIDKALELFVSNNPLKRASGARQLIELASNHDDLAYQQRIIDAFCAFLRLSTPDHRNDDEYIDSVFVEEIFINAMRRHLKDLDEPFPSWTKCLFDFRGVHFYSRVNLSGCRFQGETDWRGVHFTEGAIFSGTIFEATPTFSKASFHGEAKFDKCRFAGGIDADFSCSQFEKNACFAGAHFGGTVIFGQARSRNEDDYPDDTELFSTTFSGEADFSRAKFCGDAHFGLDKEGEGGRIPLVSHFEGPAHFEETEFQKGAYFGAVYFKKGAFFNEKKRERRKSRTMAQRPRTSGSPHTEKGAIFRGAAYFRGACFHTDGINCLRFEFARAPEADFRDCKFDDRGTGPEDIFLANIDFKGTRFHTRPLFGEAEVPCKKHRSPTSHPCWPKKTHLKEGEEGDIPEDAYCPLC